MKTKPKSIMSLLCLLAFTSFFTGCGETVISEDQMQERSDGLVYTPNSEIPFTGVVEDHYDNGQKRLEMRYKDGVKDGIWIHWYDNGQKVTEGSYKNGLEVGKWTSWYENGQMSYEANYKDGKKDGPYSRWWDGQLMMEAIYQDGELIEEKLYSLQ